MTLLVKLVLLVAPSVLIAVRPQAEIGGHNTNLQQLTDEQMSKSEAQPAQAINMKDDKVEVAPKSALIAVAEKDIHKGQVKKEQSQHSHSKAASTLKSSVVHASNKSKKVSVSAEGKVVATGEGVDIDAAWEDWLFKLIDEDGEGGVDKKEWAAAAKGQWADIMWKELDKDDDKTIDDKEFKENWDPAVTAAFKKMGGDDGEIDVAEVDAWAPATKYEKDFAKDKRFMEDGHMDRSEFEEFIYTAMVLRAIDADGDGKVTWHEVKKSKRFDEIKEKLPAGEEDFKKKFGDDGMDLGELHDFLKEKKVFMAGEGNAGARAVLAQGTVAVVIMLASWH